MASYPFTVLFTWNPSGSPFNSLRETSNVIKGLSSCSALKWEVTTTVKTCNRTVTLAPAEKKKGKEQKSCIVFIEYDDCSGVCVIHSKDSSQYTNDDVLIADENIENLLTPFAGLAHRSTRKIQGFRYNLGDYIACVGIVDSGPLAGHVVLELSYLGCEFDLATIFSQFSALANSFMSQSDRNNPDLHFKSFFRPFISSSSSSSSSSSLSTSSSLEQQQEQQQQHPTCFQFSDRALLWIESLQLLQS